MYLKNKECPLLTEAVLAELSKSGITTVISLLSRDPEILIHACSLTYQEVVSVKKVLFAKYAALPTSSDDRLNQTPIRPLSIGCSSLDQLLGGGLSAGDLVELCGASAVGKTQLCLSAAVSALRAGRRVLFADTKAEFSTARCRQMLRRRSLPAAECDRLLGQLQVASCDSVYDLFGLLETVRSRRGLHAGLRLIVVDSLATLVSPLLACPGFLGLGLLNDLGTTLKSLAADCRLTALVTNHVVQSELGAACGVRPALGLAWLPVPHVRLLLQRDATPSSGAPPQLHVAAPLRTAVLTNSVSSACGRGARFLVTSAGVEDVVSSQKRSCSDE